MTQEFRSSFRLLLQTTQTYGWNIKKHYGFISSKPPPILQELKEFENDLAELIQNIKFKDIPNHFQIKLQKDLQKIKKDDHLYIPADKTNNYYRVKPAHYEMLLERFIHKSYRRMDSATIAETTRTDLHIAKKTRLGGPN